MCAHLGSILAQVDIVTLILWPGDQARRRINLTMSGLNAGPATGPAQGCSRLGSACRTGREKWNELVAIISRMNCANSKDGANSPHRQAGALIRGGVNRVRAMRASD